MADGDRNRLIAVELDEAVFDHPNRDVEHERQVAIFDLLEDNSFGVCGHDTGPYRLFLSVQDRKLIFDIRDEANKPVTAFIFALGPFRRIIKDYFMICESYFDAIKTASPSKIEAVDMGRRGLHNEGSRLLIERLTNKIDIDMDTARRLFTLICALHWRG